MPSAPLLPRSKPKAVSTTAGDHRKRRRNRTTQSCLNCHATKRMCDRQRPCSRCSQLGLTGNCVYEVDDPSRIGQGRQDEESKMMSRIAELEGVIRELKNKPHPRWLAEKDLASSSDESNTSPSSSEGPSTPLIPLGTFPASSHPSSPRFSSHSQALGQFPLLSSDQDSVESLLSVYVGLSEHMYIQRDGTCECLTEASCYSAVLELSARLRGAAEILSRSPSHANNSACGLNARISALDALTKDSLLDIPSLAMAGGLGSATSTKNISPTPYDQFYANADTFAWDMDDIPGLNDDFLSWVPSHSSM